MVTFLKIDQHELGILVKNVSLSGLNVLVYLLWTETSSWIAFSVSEPLYSKHSTHAALF